MKSLFLRMFLWFCGATAAIAVVVTAGFLADSPGALATNWRELGQNALVAAGRTAVESYEREGQSGLAQYLERIAREMNVRCALDDTNGRRLAGFGLVPRGGAGSEGDLALRGRAGLASVRLRGANGGEYVFTASLPQRGRERWARLFFALVIVVGGLLCYLLARHVTAPVERLRAATAQFSRGELQARVRESAVLDRKDEIGGLARDFNEMAGRIETLMAAQQRLVADVSHELRSPLTRLSLAMGLLRRRADSESAAPLARMEREVERLNALIGQLLTLSRLESLDRPLAMERFELGDLVQQIAADADFEATSQDRNVRLADCAACSIRGNRDLIASAIENVVRNAVRHTDPGSTVTVRLLRANGEAEARVVVEDHGPGAPDSELRRMFEPFYRVEESRDRRSGGAGLGLAITERVARLHGGSVKAANRDAGGLEVILTLPVDPA